MNFRLPILASLIFFAGLHTPISPISADSDFSLPLYYGSDLAEQGFPSPLVHLKIGDHEAIFIVDTGGAVSTFAAWFAQDVGIEVRDSSATVRGSTGDEMKIRTVSNISGMLGNQVPVRFNEAIVIDFPPIFKTSRLGGLLSPQMLTPAGRAAVLDLRAPTLLFKPFESAEAEVGLKDRGRPEELHVCVNHKSDFPNRLYAAEISVSGVKGTVLLDTGATRTLVSDKSRIGELLRGRGLKGQQSQGVGGAPRDNRSVSGVKVDLAGQNLALASMTIGPVSSECGPDGLLGMDALRSCVLILGVSRAAIKCAVE
jgi:Aspartyl protease